MGGTGDSAWPVTEASPETFLVTVELFLRRQAAWMLSSWSTLWKIGHITLQGEIDGRTVTMRETKAERLRERERVKVYERQR